MKKIFALACIALSGSLLLTSCGGAGWTEDVKATTKTACGLMVMDYGTEDGSAICDCYVNKLVEKYPDGAIAENDATIDECKASYKTTAQKDAEAAAAAAAAPADTSGAAAATAPQ